MTADIQFTKRFFKEAKSHAFSEALPDVQKYIAAILSKGPQHGKSRVKHMTRGKKGSIWRLRLSLKDAAPHRLMFEWISNGVTPTLLLLCFVPRKDKQYDTKHASVFEKHADNVLGEHEGEALKNRILNTGNKPPREEPAEVPVIQSYTPPVFIDVNSEPEPLVDDVILEELEEIIEEADVDDLLELYASKELVHKFASSQGWGQKTSSKLAECTTTDEAIEFIQCLDDDLEESFLAFILDDESTSDLDRIYKVSNAEFGSVTERPLSSFMLTVDPDQQAAIDRPLTNKPFMVRGSAGTGKSLVCLYRLKRMLQDRMGKLNFDPGKKPKYLFLSYTNSLVESCRSLFNDLTSDMDLCDVDIKFSTLDKELVAISNTLYEQGLRIPQRNENEVYSAYADALKSPNTTTTVRSLLEEMGAPFFINEVEEILIDKNITSLDQYLETGAKRKELRKGLVVPLVEKYRRAIWAGYQQLLQRKSYVSWGQFRACILEHLEQNPQLVPKYNVVFADEVQDFGDVQMKLISLLCDHPGGIVFASDIGQTIYRRQSALSNIDEKLTFNSSNSVILMRSYRMTKQINTALHPLRQEMATLHGQKHRPAEPIYSGNKPLWITTPDHMHQSRAVNLITELRRDHNYNLGQFAVLFGTNRQAEDFFAYCEPCEGISATLHTKNKEINLNEDSIHILTAHSAKGLEFPHVIVPLANQLSIYNDTEKTNRFDLREVKDAANKLLYVACSRASESLTIIQETNAAPSAVDLLTPGDWEIETHTHEEFKAH